MSEDKFEKFDISKRALNLDRTNLEEVNSTLNPIILDTNFLFVTFQFKIDVIQELNRIISPNHSLYIYEGTISELKSVQNKNDKNKKYLPLIAKFLEVYNFKIISSDNTYVDDDILSNLNSNIFIGTNDKELKKSILAKKGKLIQMRQKSHLELV